VNFAGNITIAIHKFLNNLLEIIVGQCRSNPAVHFQAKTPGVHIRHWEVSIDWNLYPHLGDLVES
jgi:hypothetical protein